MSTNEDKLKEAIEIAECIGVYTPKDNIIIAGGAPRDLLNGKEISDIDFFVDYNKLSKSSYVKPIPNLLGGLKMKYGNRATLKGKSYTLHPNYTDKRKAVYTRYSIY